MPKEGYSKPWEDNLPNLVYKSYEYYDYKTKSESKDSKPTRIFKLEGEEFNTVIILFSIRNQKNAWKIHSEGAKRKNDMIRIIEEAVTLSESLDSKFFSFAIPPENSALSSEDYYDTLQEYFISIESKEYGKVETGANLTDALAKLEDLNTRQGYLSEFYRCELSIKGGKKYWISFVKRDKLQNYINIFDNRPYQKYTATSIKYISVCSKGATSAAISSYPHNLLITGAPGTGKSHYLYEESQKLIFDGKTLEACVNDAIAGDPSTKSDPEKRATYYDAYEKEYKNHLTRVTFYDDYSYEEFVGCYKPIMKYDYEYGFTYDGKDGCVKEDRISYEFVPGPFIDMYIKAKNDPDHVYCLIIEELNRAKAANVFGDIFQLLDRKDGESVYSIKPSNSLDEYLEDKVKEYTGYIKIPDNLYIWATMNSADRGVNPLDSAFKRRWSYKIRSVYSDRSGCKESNITFIYKGKVEKMLFDDFREVINEEIFEEDKLIGPWYFSDEELEEIKIYNDELSAGRDVSTLSNPLVEKLFVYLRQDIFRHDPPACFASDASISKIMFDYSEKKGLENILNEKICNGLDDKLNP